MTQIRPRRSRSIAAPGELGVHSLDRFNFSVPDVEQAQEILFLVRPRSARGARRARYPHPRPSAPLGLGRRGAEEEAAIHLVRRRSRTTCRAFASGSTPCGSRASIRRPALESNGLWFRDPDGTPIEIRVAEKSSPNEKSSHRERLVGRRRSPARRAAAPSRWCSRGGWRTCWFSRATSRRRSSSTARFSGCGCRTGPAT